MTERPKVLGIERYKVLNAMLTLPEFTHADLSTHTGVKSDTVRTVVKRVEHRYLARIPRGREPRQPGGQSIRYRVKPEMVKALRDEVEGLFAQVRPAAATFIKDIKVTPHRSLAALRRPPELELSSEDDAAADPTVGSEPTSLKISENVLQVLLPRAETAEEKRSLLKLAQFNIDSALSEIAMMQPDAVTNGVRARVGSVEFLHDLSLAELGSLPEEQLRTLRNRYVEVKDELLKSGEAARVTAVSDRVLDSPVRNEVVPMAAAARAGMASAGAAVGTAALKGGMVEEHTETDDLIRVAMKRVERVREIQDVIERFEACVEEADEARRRYELDELSIERAADTIRAGNRVRVNYELFRAIACDPAFYLQQAIQFAERGALLTGGSYVRAARQLWDAGHHPGHVAMRVIG